MHAADNEQRQGAEQPSPVDSLSFFM